MHVYLKRAGALAFLAAAGGCMTGACVTDEQTLVIRACLSVPQDTCTVTPSLNAAFNSVGSVDTAFAAQYTCAALVENQLVARGNVNELRPETSSVSLYEADVQVLTGLPQITGTKIISEFSEPINGFVDPGTGGLPGIGLAAVTMVDQASLKTIAGKLSQVTVSVIIRGRTLGGLEVHTNEFLFPINVTSGGTCVEPAGDTCLMPSGKPTSNCHQGEDSATDCRLLGCAQLCKCTAAEPGGHCCPGGVGDGTCCM